MSFRVLKIKEIKEEIYKIYGIKNIKIIYAYLNEGFAAMAYVEDGIKKIEIDKKTITKYKCPIFVQLSVLYHEIGHFATTDWSKNNISYSALCELNAHLWAIEASKKQGNKRVYFQLIKELNSWQRFEKIKTHNCYYKAYKMAVKKGIIK